MESTNVAVVASSLFFFRKERRWEEREREREREREWRGCGTDLSRGHFLDVTGIVWSHACCILAEASSGQRPLVKYRCKLERAHNEAPFNNAFDLN